MTLRGQLDLNGFGFGGVDLNSDLDLRKKIGSGFDLDLDLISVTGFDLDLHGRWICTPLLTCFHVKVS